MDTNHNNIDFNKLFSHFEKLPERDDLIPLIKEIKADLAEIKEGIYNRNTDDIIGFLLPLEKAVATLHISKRQFHSLRAKGAIEYYRIGKKIYVSKKDLHSYMEAHKVLSPKKPTK